LVGKKGLSSQEEVQKVRGKKKPKRGFKLKERNTKRGEKQKGEGERKTGSLKKTPFENRGGGNWPFLCQGWGREPRNEG